MAVTRPDVLRASWAADRPSGYSLVRTQLCWALGGYLLTRLGCLLQLLRQNWLLAAGLAVLAGAARPNGIVLGGVLALTVALAWRDPAARTLRSAAFVLLVPLVVGLQRVGDRADGEPGRLVLSCASAAS